MLYVDELLTLVLAAIQEARWSDARELSGVLEGWTAQGVTPSPAVATPEILAEAGLSVLRCCDVPHVRRELATFLLSGACAAVWAPGAGDQPRGPVHGPVEHPPDPPDVRGLGHWLRRTGGAS